MVFIVRDMCGLLKTHGYGFVQGVKLKHGWFEKGKEN